MHKFNEDIRVDGTVTASEFDGPLSEKTMQPFVDENAALWTELAELSANINGNKEQIAELNAMNAELPEKIVERVQVQIDGLAKRYSQVIAELTAKLNSALAQNDTLTQSYNNAIKVINDLAERVAALEANYDPTIIK